jgi:hypothetical protein
MGVGIAPCSLHSHRASKEEALGVVEGFIEILASSIWRRLPTATMTSRSPLTTKATKVRRTKVLRTPIRATLFH